MSLKMDKGTQMSGFIHLPIEDYCEINLNLKDCFLMMLSYMVKFDNYLKKTGHDGSFENQSKLAMFLLMRSCEPFGFQEVFLQNNQICFKENKDGKGECVRRVVPLDQDCLFDTFIEIYMKMSKKAKTPSVPTVTKPNTTESDSDTEIEKTPPKKRKDTSDGTLNHNKESHRSGKNQTTLEIKTPPKKNNKKKTDLEEKQEIKEYSRENLRRSTRVRRPMPLDRRQLVHRTIQKALGKTDEEIMTSYIELYSGKKNKVTNQSFSAPRNTSTPLKSCNNENGIKRTNEVSESADDADSDSSPKAKKNRHSAPVIASEILISGQENRYLTPKSCKTIHKLCQKVPRLPSKTNLKNKKMDQKMKLLSSKSGRATSGSGTRKLYSEADWLARLNEELGTLQSHEMN